MLFFQQTINGEKFVHPQWIITPLPAPKRLLVLSGVVIIDFWSGLQAGWHSDSVQIFPDQDLQSAFAFAGVLPPPQGFTNRFEV